MADTANVIVTPPPGQTITDGNTINIEIDVVPKETHDLKNTVTNHPVEVGGDITDHVRPEPDTFSLDCIISNTPPPPLTPSPTRGIDAYNALKTLRDNGTLCTVMTTLKRYTNVVITHVSIARDSSTYNGLTFTVDFQQIILVQNAQTKRTISKDVRVQKKVETGAQPTTAVETSKLRGGADAYTKTGGSWKAAANKVVFGVDPIGAN